MDKAIYRKFEVNIPKTHIFEFSGPYSWIGQPICKILDTKAENVTHGLRRVGILENQLFEKTIGFGHGKDSQFSRKSFQSEPTPSGNMESRFNNAHNDSLFQFFLFLLHASGIPLKLLLIRKRFRLVFDNKQIFRMVFIPNC